MQRKYEYVRRQWKDEEDESRKEMQKVTAKRIKYRARRKRKYDTRGLVAHESE